MFKKPLSKAELGELAAKAGGVSAIFSWKSPTARKQGLTQGSLSDAQMLDLMIESPQLIRRPIIIKDGKMQLGFGSKQGLTI